MKAVVYFLISCFLFLSFSSSLKANQKKDEWNYVPIRTSDLSKVPDASPSFKNVKVAYNNDKYLIRGQANVANGSFYYSVEDGHRVIIKETLIKVNKEAPHWTDFSFSLPKEKVESHNCFLLLYERDEKDGKIIHTYVINLSK